MHFYGTLLYTLFIAKIDVHCRLTHPCFIHTRTTHTTTCYHKIIYQSNYTQSNIITLNFPPIKPHITCYSGVNVIFSRKKCRNGYIFIYFYNIQTSDHTWLETSRSIPNLVIKQSRAVSVLDWVTFWERTVLLFALFFSIPWPYNATFTGRWKWLNETL